MFSCYLESPVSSDITAHLYSTTFKTMIKNCPWSMVLFHPSISHPVIHGRCQFVHLFAVLFLLLSATGADCWRPHVSTSRWEDIAKWGETEKKELMRHQGVKDGWLVLQQGCLCQPFVFLKRWRLQWISNYLRVKLNDSCFLWNCLLFLFCTPIRCWGHNLELWPNEVQGLNAYEVVSCLCTI